MYLYVAGLCVKADRRMSLYAIKLELESHVGTSMDHFKVSYTDMVRGLSLTSDGSRSHQTGKDDICPV